MQALKRWPWVTLLAGGAIILSPLGRDFIYSAFFAGEALARNIAQPFVYGGILALAALALIEWLIRWQLFFRRDKAGAAQDKPHAGSSHDGTGRG
ncbi:MAG: hypothetical protein HY659_06890 [Rhizobiales bacterium]|nr:hypothetical protein [Hyphomicrobiales bacterium]